jgi:hypothetical protein
VLAIVVEKKDGAQIIRAFCLFIAKSFWYEDLGKGYCRRGGTRSVKKNSSWQKYNCSYKVNPYHEKHKRNWGKPGLLYSFPKY